MMMVTYNEYLKGILERVIESYHTLEGLGDRPEDLEVIKTELLKIRGFFLVLSGKLDAGRYRSTDIEGLQSGIRRYLNSYYFEQEIDNISSLYAGDSDRIRNVRLIILDSLRDKELMESIAEIAGEL